MFWIYYFFRHFPFLILHITEYITESNTTKKKTIDRLDNNVDRTNEYSNICINKRSIIRIVFLTGIGVVFEASDQGNLIDVIRLDTSRAIFVAT